MGAGLQSWMSLGPRVHRTCNLVPKLRRGPWGTHSWTNLRCLGHGSGRTVAPRCPVQSTPPAPPRAGHAVSLQPNTGHACGSQGQAGLATATAATALPCPQKPRQPSRTHHPNFTWKHGHVHMDATALQHPAINSMQAMAGVAGCFAINSGENGSSCDSGFCPLSLELF